MKTAILTGFSTFGNYTVNPTEILTRHLDGKTLAGHLIHSFVLPTEVICSQGTINHGRQVVEKAVSMKASAIISLGIASEARGVRVETKCINWLENNRYCTEFENRRPVDYSSRIREEKFVQLDKWNLSRLSEELASLGISFEISNNAGTYCCNALMYRTLQHMQEWSIKIPFIFAHVPCTEESIANIVGFDRKSKILVRQEELVVVVEKFLEAYM